MTVVKLLIHEHQFHVNCKRRVALTNLMGLRELNKRIWMKCLAISAIVGILPSSHINITEPALPSMGEKNQKDQDYFHYNEKNEGNYYCITSNEK